MADKPNDGRWGWLNVQFQNVQPKKDESQILRLLWWLVFWLVVFGGLRLLAWLVA